jgi:magnesium-transporting ATPase (P-type)
MAKQGLKVMSYAFKEILLEDLDNLIHSVNVESDEFRDELEADLVYLGTFALEDPLRPDLDTSIQFLKFGHLQPDQHE